MPRKHLNLSNPSQKPYNPKIQNNDEAINRSIQEGTEYDRLALAGKKQDLWKALIKHGYSEKQLEGKQTREMMDMLEAFNED